MGISISHRSAETTLSSSVPMAVDPLSNQEECFSVMDEIWIHQYILESKQRYYHFLWFLKCFERQKLVHVLHISFLYECPTINFLYHCGFLDKVKFTYRQKWRDVIILHDNTMLHTVLQTYKKTRRFILDSYRTSITVGSYVIIICSASWRRKWRTQNRQRQCCGYVRAQLVRGTPLFIYLYY